LLVVVFVCTKNKFCGLDVTMAKKTVFLPMKTSRLVVLILKKVWVFVLAGAILVSGVGLAGVVEGCKLLLGVPQLP
jgi:hypothetical protein